MHLTWHIWHIVEATLGLNPTPTPSDQLLSPGPYMATRYGPAFTLHLCPPRSSHSHSFALELYLNIWYICLKLYLWELDLLSALRTPRFSEQLWSQTLPLEVWMDKKLHHLEPTAVHLSPVTVGHRRSPCLAKAFSSVAWPRCCRLILFFDWNIFHFHPDFILHWNIIKNAGMTSNIRTLGRDTFPNAGTRISRQRMEISCPNV